ncbi:ATP-binding cassette domain-containing protein [Thalassorhabdomicrobium marinisediminis]|uniref:ABC transporter ATP-binding protein n=1 Tax=Thalassorhabdomicrobium marinisediminis TaxID=2170577 RepID=A0A2T7FZN2_9RHOB|nr:ATP-binding cassette domain-containing protein [Thalassorhabdomicrobium marinisediminis]PVA07623.1 ABC transporter ATP-binding protein [Thalassorhabdomicrobium marinisediminis]
MDKGLTLRKICILKDAKPLIEVDHHIPPGEILTVMGPSGVGKSTLLAYITGTLGPDFTGMGEIALDGRDITTTPPHLRQIGILFQDDLLFPHMSVGANLAFGMPPGGRRAVRQRLIAEALRDVGLEGYANRDPATLSGGQRARVALVRMMLSQPKALLLDEAFSRLDVALRAQVRTLIFQTAQDRGLPVLMVTHDAEDAAAAKGPVIELRSLSGG